MIAIRPLRTHILAGYQTTKTIGPELLPLHVVGTIFCGFLNKISLLISEFYKRKSEAVFMVDLRQEVLE